MRSLWTWGLVTNVRVQETERAKEAKETADHTEPASHTSSGGISGGEAATLVLTAFSSPSAVVAPPVLPGAESTRGSPFPWTIPASPLAAMTAMNQCFSQPRAWQTILREEKAELKVGIKPREESAELAERIIVHGMGSRQTHRHGWGGRERELHPNYTRCAYSEGKGNIVAGQMKGKDRRVFSDVDARYSREHLHIYRNADP